MLKSEFSFRAVLYFISILLLCRFLPYVGWVTIIMTDKPIIKVCLCVAHVNKILISSVFFMHLQPTSLGINAINIASLTEANFIFTLCLVLAVHYHWSAGIAGHNLEGLGMQV